jgi:N-acetylglucosamine kinase-like BadF-type ATPase
VIDVVLGVDIGGSGTRGSLAKVAPGEPLQVVATAEVQAPLRVDAHGIVSDHVADLVARVIRELQNDYEGSIAAVALGCAGVSHQGERVRHSLPRLVGRLSGSGLVVICSDTITSYLGALGWRPGAVVAAGTGAVGVGADMRGTWRRVDGWGYNIGDVGGGAWIGRSGLDAGLRAHDGRTGGSPALLKRLRNRFGDPAMLAGELARRNDRAALLASFAPDVFDAANQGDERSAEIVAEAGRHLAETAVAALLPDVSQVVGFGRLITANDRLAASFAESVRARAPAVEVHGPRGSGCDGAALLAAAALRGELPKGTDAIGVMQVHRLTPS